MHLITHRNHITDNTPDELTDFIICRFDQLAQETDVPPNIINGFTYLKTWVWKPICNMNLR